MILREFRADKSMLDAVDGSPYLMSARLLSRVHYLAQCTRRTTHRLSLLYSKYDHFNVPITIHVHSGVPLTSTRNPHAEATVWSRSIGRKNRATLAQAPRVFKVQGLPEGYQGRGFQGRRGLQPPGVFLIVRGGLGGS